MSDCIHEEVCGTCDVEPEECGYYEPKRGTCSMYYGEDDDGIDSFWCSECGCRQAATFEHTEAGDLIERHIIEPRYCQNCGREVSE